MKPKRPTKPKTVQPKSRRVWLLENNGRVRFTDSPYCAMGCEVMGFTRVTPGTWRPTK